MKTSRILAAGVAAAGFGFGILGSALPASAAGIGGLSVRPATFDPNDPATRAYFKPVVSPGQTYSGAVVVSNTSDSPLTAYAYPVDGLTAQTSGAVYGNRGQALAKAGTWVTLATSTITVAPHSQTNLDFTVKVPADAQPGNDLAGVAVEDETPQSATAAGSNFTVHEVFRAVVGVDVTVPGPARFGVQLGSPGIQVLAGTTDAMVKIPITDIGTALGKPALTVTVSGPAGYHRSVVRSLDTLLPGDPIDYPFIWPDDLSKGRYTATVSASAPGMSTVYSAGTSTLGTVLQGAAAPGAPKKVVVLQAGTGLSKGEAGALLLALIALFGAASMVWRTAANRRPLHLA